MIPRHPGDPERLPKVSKRAWGVPLLGRFRSGGSRCSGTGASGRPNPCGHGQADRCLARLRGGRKVWAGGRVVPGLMSHLRGTRFVREEKGGLLWYILDSARGHPLACNEIVQLNIFHSSTRR